MTAERRVRSAVAESIAACERWQSLHPYPAPPVEHLLVDEDAGGRPIAACGARGRGWYTVHRPAVTCSACLDAT